VLDTNTKKMYIFLKTKQSYLVILLLDIKQLQGAQSAPHVLVDINKGKKKPKKGPRDL
jgi:hypothetical protein